MLSIHCKIAVFFISPFDLSAILKIRNREHAHYVGLVVAYTWNREKQMFVALGKEFDMMTGTKALSVSGYGPPSADLDPPTKLSENIILNVLVKMDDTLRSSAH